MRSNLCNQETNFWENAPTKEGYKGIYGAVFCAIIHLMKTENCDTLIDFNSEINKYAHAGRDTLKESLNWLDANKFITYKAKINQTIPSKVSIIPGNEIQLPASYPPVTRQSGGSYPTSAPRTYAWPRGNGLATGVEDIGLIENTSNSNQTNKRGLGENPVSPDGSAGAEGYSINFPSLENLVAQFSRDKPHWYPQEFYEEFIDYYDQQSDKDPTLKVWQLGLGDNKAKHIAKLMENSWNRIGRERYPGWLHGVNHKEQRRQYLLRQCPV